MNFQFKPIKYNYSSRHGNKISFIVIHDTANYGKGANALSHHRYFGGGNRNASAHYFVDDKGIIQIIGDSYSAWHCGDKWNRKYATRNDVTNSNSIGIEMCVNSDGNYQTMYKNTVELVKNLMVKFNIPIDRIVRHFDATGKPCPSHMKLNNWAKWWQFKEDIKKPIEWRIDLSKDSFFGDNVNVSKEKEVKVMNNEFEEAKKLGITDGSRPKDTATREEVAMMVLRGIKIAKGEVLPNISKEPT